MSGPESNVVILLLRPRHIHEKFLRPFLPTPHIANDGDTLLTGALILLIGSNHWNQEILRQRK